MSKKRLLKHFKDAKEKKQNAKWSIRNGEYCLHVDGHKNEV